ncbi:glycosyltransferase family 2 protein [Gelidibacter maritimus]|uniref:Glycosyltransferase n=1 Tax=Gelidibacter maritimus TaxID=2761487 RepID=A0A7W2M5N8_9FLAO|nr:glycosyltransferase [Gelidibacter maritimus]MBA6153153.1 glycosyltransferase [Gelidibacter maritimus]
MIFICFGISLLYVLVMASFILGFDRVKTFQLSHLKPKTHFSIIIAFRNEEKRLPPLLESIVNLNYPNDHFEIIFVDDESNDTSVQLVRSMLANNRHLNVTLIKNIRSSNSPKKDAISLGISEAQYDWIVTTDADCVLPKYWLESFDEFIQKRLPDFIAAPITYVNCHGFLQNFQLLDVLSLQGATIGGFGIRKPFLCNGANLAYKKELFKTLNGFQGNKEIASGDDVFLLEKATKLNANKVHYLKCQDAVVATSALTSWSELVEQRVRWAAKTNTYKNWFGKLVGLIVLSLNALLISCVLLVIIGIMAPLHLLIIFLVKFSIDFLLIFKTANFFNQKNHLKHYYISSFLYPFFSVIIIFLTVFKGFKWKDRSYKK